MTPEENRARVAKWQRDNPDKVKAKNARAYQRRKEARQLKSRMDYRKRIETPWHPVRDVTLGSRQSV